MRYFLRQSPLSQAGMAELADAADSKSADRKVVGVRPPLPVPFAYSTSQRFISISAPQPPLRADEPSVHFCAFAVDGPKVRSAEVFYGDLVLLTELPGRRSNFGAIRLPKARVRSKPKSSPPSNRALTTLSEMSLRWDSPGRGKIVYPWGIGRSTQERAGSEIIFRLLKLSGGNRRDPWSWSLSLSGFRLRGKTISSFTP